MQHMDEGRLQAWLDGPRGELSDDEHAVVTRHLASCAECSARVQVLRETTERAGELLSLPEAAADDELPDFESVVARARDFESTGSPRRRWVAPAWAATVVLALGVGWLANEMGRGSAGRVAPEPAARAVAELDEAPRSVEPESRPDEMPSRESIGPEPEVTVATAAPSPAPVTVRGRVTDAATGRPLESAQVFLPETGVGALTDREGAFSLALDSLPDPADEEVELRVDLIGYESADRAVALGRGDTVSNEIELRATALQLQELTVEGVAAGTPELRLRQEAPRMPIEGKGAAADQPADGWRPMTAEEARETVGFAVRTVPGLEIVSRELGTVDGEPVVRVVQRLGDGGRLTMLQAARVVRFDFDAGDASSEARVSKTLPDGVFVLARGSLPADSLRALLDRLR